jgi:hypothetical protein
MDTLGIDNFLFLKMFIGLSLMCWTIAVFARVVFCEAERRSGAESSIRHGRIVMHATVRNYSGTGSKELIDLLEKRKDEVKGLLTSIKGFVSYSLVRTAQGGFSVSVYQDKAGVDESMKRSKEWIGQNASATGAGAPTVSEGSVVLHA